MGLDRNKNFGNFINLRNFFEILEILDRNSRNFRNVGNFGNFRILRNFILYKKCGAYRACIGLKRKKEKKTPG